MSISITKSYPNLPKKLDRLQIVEKTVEHIGWKFLKVFETDTRGGSRFNLSLENYFFDDYEANIKITSNLSTSGKETITGSLEILGKGKTHLSSSKHTLLMSNVSFAELTKIAPPLFITVKLLRVGNCYMSIIFKSWNFKNIF